MRGGYGVLGSRLRATGDETKRPARLDGNYACQQLAGATGRQFSSNTQGRIRAGADQSPDRQTRRRPHEYIRDARTRRGV